MPRPRKKSPSALPKYVYKTNAAYIYRPYLGKNKVTGKVQWGEHIVLAPLGSHLSTVHRRYEEVIGARRELRTLGWLLDEYLKSRKFQSLAYKTRKDYEQMAQVIKRQRVGGLEFGDAPLKRIAPTTIQSYIETYPSPVSANRHRSLISSAWGWGRRMFEGIPINPVPDTEKNPEISRSRYVDQDEYLAIWKAASPWLKVAMEISYLCRARISEVASMRWDDVVTEEGIYVARRKGSEDEITRWSPRLKTALAMAETLPRYKRFINAPQSPFVVHGQSMEPIRGAYKSAWQRAVQKAGVDNPPVFHDLKAAGISDQSTPWAGHRDPKMLRVYLRKKHTRIVDGSDAKMSQEP